MYNVDLESVSCELHVCECFRLMPTQGQRTDRMDRHEPWYSLTTARTFYKDLRLSFSLSQNDSNLPLYYMREVK